MHQHHELIDGSGYPEGLTGENLPISVNTPQKRNTIFRNAMLLAVANEYDILVSGRRDGELHTPEEAISLLVRDAGVLWNSYAVRALQQTVQLYPPGVQVAVKRAKLGVYAGCTGIVVANKSDAPLHPTIILTHDRQGDPMEPVRVDTHRETGFTLELLV
ncbi:MAG: Cyclic di-GMP phosphodiesterase response regulator RpfG [Calditrichaeota bacterium]|nr:Cyclic di-GMP phosphodiesterase response regulator RpfG [Calditrichota bacterium]